MSASPKLPPDHEARRRATRDFSTNLVVVAGAGTGKTSLLVERALMALGSGLVEAGQVAAITFTEKAAGEMQQRLATGLEHLRALAVGTPPTDLDRTARAAFDALTLEGKVSPAAVAERTLLALRQLDRMAVKNMHALCIDLLRGWPREAGVDPHFRIDPGPQFTRLVESAWPDFLEIELGPAAPRRDLWSRLLQRVPVTEIARAARDLADFRIPSTLLDTATPPPEVRELFGSLCSSLILTLDDLLARRDEINPGRSTFADKLEHLRTGLVGLHEAGLDGLRAVMKATTSLAACLDKPAPRPTPKVSAMLAATARVTAQDAHRLLRDLRHVDETLVRDLLAAVSPFARQVRDTYLARGLVGFDGLLHLTRDLLRDHPDVREAIRRRYRLLLVDEFQDTDPVQYEIVLFLAEHDGDSSADPYRARLAPGRLFIVGDPKQSIYRFRGADHGEFHRATSRVIDAGGVSLDLVANFRSVPGIVEALNGVFAAGAGTWREGPYQPPYIPIQPTRVKNHGAPAVEIWTLDASAASGADQRRRLEGENIAAEIARLVEDNKKDNSFRYEDFTLVLGAFTSVASYLRPLRHLGIPFVVDGGPDFLGRAEIRTFIALLRSLTSPDDAIALLAVLRSPVAGVPDKELAAFVAAGGPWDWAAATTIDAARFPRVDACFRLLRRLAAETRDLPADLVPQHVLTHSPLLPLAAAAFEGAQQVANLHRLAAVAGRQARDGGLTLRQVLDALTGNHGADMVGDAPVADAARQAVQVLTIHRAKGLENRVVIVPDLAREKRGDSARKKPVVEMTRDQRGRPLSAVRLAAGDGTACSAARVWFEGEQRHHEEAEHLRVLYVAMTRARDRLVLLTGSSRSAAPWVEALRPWGYDIDVPLADGALLADGRVLHRVMRSKTVRSAVGTPSTTTPTEAAEIWTAAVERIVTTAHPPVRTPSGAGDTGHDASDAADHAPRQEHTAGVGRAVGIGVHRLLETWDGETASLLAAVPTAAARAAAETGDDASRVQKETAELIGTFLASDLAARFRGAARRVAELPVQFQAPDGTVWGGNIDLLYQPEGRSEWIVADYKTDRDGDPGVLAGRHAGQLALYVAAVARALDLRCPPSAEIWHVRSGRVVPVNVDGPLAALMAAPSPG